MSLNQKIRRLEEDNATLKERVLSLPEDAKEYKVQVMDELRVS